MISLLGWLYSHYYTQIGYPTVCEEHIGVVGNVVRSVLSRIGFNFLKIAFVNEINENIVLIRSAILETQIFTLSLPSSIQFGHGDGRNDLTGSHIWDMFFSLLLLISAFIEIR